MGKEHPWSVNILVILHFLTLPVNKIRFRKEEFCSEDGRGVSRENEEKKLKEVGQLLPAFRSPFLALSIILS